MSGGNIFWGEISRSLSYDLIVSELMTPDIRPEWKHQRGRPCRTWVQQIEDDTGLNANDAWRIAHDRKSGGGALRPVAGQAFY